MRKVTLMETEKRIFDQTFAPLSPYMTIFLFYVFAVTLGSVSEMDGHVNHGLNDVSTSLASMRGVLLCIAYFWVDEHREHMTPSQLWQRCRYLWHKKRQPRKTAPARQTISSLDTNQKTPERRKRLGTVHFTEEASVRLIDYREDEDEDEDEVAKYDSDEEEQEERDPEEILSNLLASERVEERKAAPAGDEGG